MLPRVFSGAKFGYNVKNSKLEKGNFLSQYSFFSKNSTQFGKKIEMYSPHLDSNFTSVAF
jgi:hypothetical protein